MSPKISVLIPVYNTQKYLRECLQSVQKQTFTDFEIICLDDGSTDDSLNQLKNFQIHEPRLRVLTQANAGVAATRNRLIQQARGEYIAFVDADDLIAPDYLEKLYTAAQESHAPITKCFFQCVSENRSQFIPTDRNSVHEFPSDILAERFAAGYYDSVVWRKLFLRKWLLAKDLFFFDGRIAEDLPFEILAFAEAEKITVVPQILYFYRKGIDSSVSANPHKMAVNILHNLLDLHTQLYRRNLIDPQTNDVWIHWVVWGICRFRKFPHKEYQSLLKKAWALIKKENEKCSFIDRLRWNGLFFLVRICGWWSVFFWTKIFR